MGSQHSHEKIAGDGSGHNTPRGGSRRGTVTIPGSDSSNDIQENQAASSLVPVEKLAKILSHKSQKEEGVHGITEKVFVKYLFPRYSSLGALLFRHVRRGGGGRGKADHVTAAAFRTQVERLLAMLDDSHIVEVYLRMFSSSSEEDVITSEEFHDLMLLAATLSLDHHPGGPTTCPMLEKTLSSLVGGCFHSKSSHTVGFVVRWALDTCHRLILPVHRYTVHVLSTSYRTLEGESAPPSPASPSPAPAPAPGGGGSEEESRDVALVPLSAAWLLGALASPLYTLQKPPTGEVSLAAWLSRLVSVSPAHWQLLYAARRHGLGANRLTHHVTHYRSPSVMALSGSRGPLEVVVCLLSPEEWRDSPRCFGNDHAAVIQIYPEVRSLARGAKLLFLNVSHRGVPRGLRAGADARDPLLIVDEDFTTLTLAGDNYTLNDIEVWGCGDSAIRESQLDVKKWQVKEAERQRCVKLSPADWIEHPDRYLLELAGRPQYNNSAS